MINQLPIPPEKQVLFHEKIAELAELIMSTDGYTSAKANLDLFMNDEESKAAHAHFYELIGELERRKAARMPPPSPEEKARVEAAQKAILTSPQGRQFAQAQAFFHDVKEAITTTLQHALETGTLPVSK